MRALPPSRALEHTKLSVSCNNSGHDDRATQRREAECVGSDLWHAACLQLVDGTLLARGIRLSSRSTIVEYAHDIFSSEVKPQCDVLREEVHVNVKMSVSVSVVPSPMAERRHPSR